MDDVLIIVLMVYFSPSIIALLRRHNSVLAIILLNTFLGWTLAGWFWSLFAALTVDTRRRDRRVARWHAEAIRHEFDPQPSRLSFSEDRWRRLAAPKRED